MLKLLKCYYSFKYISWTFLHHYVNVVSYWTNSTFKHGYFWSRVVSNETLQLSIELIALIKQMKLPCSHFDISVSGGAKKMVQTADKHTEISNVSKMNQSSFRWLSNSYIWRPFSFWFQLMDDHISFMSTFCPFDGKLLLYKNNNSLFTK